MIQFILFATLLMLVVAVFIVPPLWKKQRAAVQEVDRKAANLGIFRDQLADLEREKADGTLNEADFSQARSELQRRLLDEIEPTLLEAPASIEGGSRKTAVALMLALPVLAFAGYMLLGKPAALDPGQVASGPAAGGQQEMTPEQIEAMVGKLADRMKANPDDLQGWVMLARSYKVLGKYDLAAESYAKAESMVSKDPELLASYAETLAMAGGGKGLAGKPRKLVEQALKIDPKHGHSLFLAGAAALEAGDRKQGIAYWEALLPQVEPGSELDQMLRSGIEQMKQGK